MITRVTLSRICVTGTLTGIGVADEQLILRDAGGVSVVGPFRIVRGGLQVEGEPTYEEWQKFGVWLQRIEQAVQWVLGDWLNYGEGRWGEMYSQAIEATGMEYQTLADIKWTAGQFTFSRRRENLTFAHHREVASIPPKVADAILATAEETTLSTREVRQLVRQYKNSLVSGDMPDSPGDCCTVDNLSTLVTNGVKFGTIYADPPWQYGNQATRASTDNHYGTMTIDEIAALPVRELAAEQSHLWLWTTNAFLFECPKLFAEWGFEFKSSFIWVKPQMGIGNYLRNSHEFLLLAVRGGLVGAAKNVMSWGEFDRTRHSAKPERIRCDVVERLSPSPRLELFGRRVAPDWVVWGNEVSSTVFDGSVKEIS